MGRWCKSLFFVVELEDGSIANVEVQKVGYLFPGERASCYSSDLLLRQYKRVRSRSDRVNVYRDVKDVYVIVLMETSPEMFSQFPEIYVHNFEQKSDTGLQMPLLQKYSFITLDFFKRTRQNKPISSRLDAWLWFFIMDGPEEIEKLITAYPEFKELYRQIYGICRNLEDVMGLFSEELRILDRNTTKYMMDEMQKEIDLQKEELEKTNEELEKTNQELGRTSEELERANEQLLQKEEKLSQREKELIDLRQKYQELLQDMEDLRRKV